jgi:hypothetical protein
VDTDRPLKVLFERQGQSLLPFIGERRTDVRVTAVESVELPVSKRTIDSVMRLERDGLVWYRHLEFEAQKDADARRGQGRAGLLVPDPGAAHDLGQLLVGFSFA